MQIIPIKFHIHLQDLGAATPEDLEQSIKDEIMSYIHDTIQPMLDNENFITMIPDEKMDQVFNVELNIMIGSANEYIDATSEVTRTILNNLKSAGMSEAIAQDLTKVCTAPLISLVS